jgi:hypothetical protein
VPLLCASGIDESLWTESASRGGETALGREGSAAQRGQARQRGMDEMQVGYVQRVLTVLIIGVVVVLLLIVFAVVQFGDSGVSRARENAYWKGGTGPNPPLRYDPDARFKPPAAPGQD